MPATMKPELVAGRSDSVGADTEVKVEPEVAVDGTTMPAPVSSTTDTMMPEALSWLPTK